MIILPRGKNCYKHLPMVVDNSQENIQHKMNDLFQGFEFFCTCINQLLISTKEDYIYPVLKLELMLNIPMKIVLKCNIKRTSFEETEMKYLGFRVTCDGI